MKFNISYPLTGAQKCIDIDDDKKCSIFYDKRMGTEIPADPLGDEFKGYVFKITGGNDKDGFPMKQGVLVKGRVRLLLSKGTSCYRPRRTGERKKKSVRGCIVGPDIRVLALAIVKKGEKDIPALTTEDKDLGRRLGPKRATRIRKLFNLKKKEDKDSKFVLVKKAAIRRTWNTAAGKKRQKAPKIQRLVTGDRLRRKRLYRAAKKETWKKNSKAADEYTKFLTEWKKKQQKKDQTKEETKAPTTTAKKDDTKKPEKPGTGKKTNEKQQPQQQPAKGGKKDAPVKKTDDKKQQPVAKDQPKPAQQKATQQQKQTKPTDTKKDAGTDQTVKKGGAKK